MHHLNPCSVNSTDWHHQGVDDHIAVGNTVVGRPLNDFFGDLEALVGIFGNTSFVVGDSDDRGTVLRHQRQHPLKNFIFTGNRVHESFALINRESCFQRFDDRGVDTKRYIRDRLHQLHRLRENSWLIRERNARVHIKHVSTRSHLREGVGFNPAVVAVFHFFGQNFPPRGVDPLANNDKGLIKADVHFPARGTDGGRRHDRLLLGGCLGGPGHSTVERLGFFDNFTNAVFLFVGH